MLAVFGPVNTFRLGAQYRHTGLMQPGREIERCLTAELYNNPHRFFRLHNMQYIFQRQGFKIEFIGGIIIGADRFGITVDHDAFNAFFVQRKRCVHTTVIKLNSLADTVWTATQDHYLGLIRYSGFALSFIGGIKIWCSCFKLRSTCIHKLIHRFQIQIPTPLLQVIHTGLGKMRQLNI